MNVIDLLNWRLKFDDGYKVRANELCENTFFSQFPTEIDAVVDP